MRRIRVRGGSERADARRSLRSRHPAPVRPPFRLDHRRCAAARRPVRAPLQRLAVRFAGRVPQHRRTAQGRQHRHRPLRGHRTPGTRVACAVEALSPSFATVGWKVVELPESQERTRRFSEELATTYAATAGQVKECWVLQAA
ncbi:DUF4307 domain-containing protein [Leucobacter sp. HNU]|uniref:DUF4307 domain-containing protein n=1 Tax=Leucobacter sp. HNU TaxID=3236805 RepID=UPI003A80C5A1